MRHGWPLIALLAFAAPLPAQVRGAMPDMARRIDLSADTVRDTVSVSDDDSAATARADSVAALPTDTPTDTISVPSSWSSDLAELGLRVYGRGELGSEWSRREPCDPALRLNCAPTLFPKLRPELELGVQVAGTVSERVHIDVDYDQHREFDATNTINVYYQGLPGEVLRRVEVGDVSLRLPSSHYLAAGVPSGNFGLKAEARLGPLDLQSVWARRGGEVEQREFRFAGGQDGTLRDARLELDDAEYVQGQFFFIVDPAAIEGYPHIDILSLRAMDAPAARRPLRSEPLRVYRDERPSSLDPQQQAQLGYFAAEAISEDGAQRHGGRFRRLVLDEDYRVHPSGLWIVLRTPLRADEALAVAYTTEAGEPVGDADAEHAPAGTVPELRLVRGPASLHRPGRSTWRYEMRQLYRLDATSSVEPGEVELEISLGQAAAGETHTDVEGRTLSYLRLFGLDESAPSEQLDAVRVFRPGTLAAMVGDDDRFPGTFIVFPTLEPFSNPPPSPGTGLSAEQARDALGSAANPAIYEHEDPVQRRNRARFRLNLEYRVRADGMSSAFSLGAYGIRSGSERITVDGRELQRDIDYTIDYALGLVTLTHPQAIFAANPDAEVRATWEQQAIFDVAPASLFGLNARLDAGTAGALDFVGLYHTEHSMMNRPRLGMEAASIALGGVSGDFEWPVTWLDRVATSDAAASRLRVGGELALSLPQPFGRDGIYVDDFESSDVVPIGLDRSLWHLGARPDSPLGAEHVLPASLEVETAAQLVWQHDILDDAGRTVGPLPTRAIDRQVQLAGTDRTEPVLYLSFGDGTDPAGEPRWRSITTVLEPTGRDMSQSEVLEFYAAAPSDRDLALVLDLGAVGEDAFYFDDEGRTRGVYPDGRPWGLGVLDEEARTREHEVWGPELDSLGLWDQACRASPGQQAYPLGDPRANCTRGNGRPDTEDLDGDGRLEAHDGALFRYVVPLGEDSPYLVRDSTATGTDFGLYRIPLRGPDAVPVGGATDETWRSIKNLRLTLTGDASGPHGVTLRLSRMRVVGSSWAKYDTHGVARGTWGDETGRGSGITTFRVGPVSRVTDGDAYVSPPGIGDELDDPDLAFGGTATEYNESALRLSYEQLQPDDRVEAYHRFVQQPHNFLDHRELRIWALARSGRWGPEGDERLVVSVGTDPRNRYLFRTPLRAPTGSSARRDDWLPELVIDFEPWFELKARAEEQLLAGEHPPGEPVVVWSADSAYAVVMEDRARAPNLSAVRELAFAIHNAGGLPADGELWVNDVRLGRGGRGPGAAGHVDLELLAGELGSAKIAYANRGPRFRQDAHEVDYRGTHDVSVGGDVELGRLVPEEWELEAPLSVTHTRTGVEPVFLEGGDTRADRVPGARRTGSRRTRVALTLRRAAPGENPWLASVLDASTLRLAYQSSTTDAMRTRDAAHAFDAALTYDHRPTTRDIQLTPPPIESVLRAVVPAMLQRTTLFRRVLNARLRWSPEAVSLSTAYADRNVRTRRYGSILASPSDAEVAPVESPRRTLESTTRLELRPLESLSAGLNLTTGRDLLDTERAITRPHARRAIDRARARPAGLDLGWEASRRIDTRLDFRPTVTSWLRPALLLTGEFRTDRDPSYWELEAAGGDTTAVLRRALRGERRLTRSLLIDPAGLSAALGGTTAVDAPRLHAARLARQLTPIDLSWNDAIGSRFDWESVEPGLGYQLGFGGYDDFLAIDGDTAASTSRHRAFRARGGVRLPTHATLEIAYDNTVSDVRERIGGERVVEERGWPDLRLHWPDLPLPASLRSAIVHGAFSIGYRHTLRSSRYGGIVRHSTRDEDQVPLHLNIGLANGLTASYTGTLGRGTGEDPTGATREREDRHSVHLSGRFQAPPQLRSSLPDPVRATLHASSHTHRRCRATLDRCTPFVDITQRQLGLTLDTRLSQLNVGLQANYTQRVNTIGIGPRTRGLQMTVYGEFDIEG